MSNVKMKKVVVNERKHKMVKHVKSKSTKMVMITAIVMAFSLAGVSPSLADNEPNVPLFKTAFCWYGAALVSFIEGTGTKGFDKFYGQCIK